MFMQKISNSWEFAKLSYGIIWDHKKLVIFPILSGAAAILVTASFVLPLWGTGTLEQWASATSSSSSGSGSAANGGEDVPIAAWITLFLFYFCNYFVIVFFNAALTASVIEVMKGQPPRLGYGLSIAAARLPQIVGWAALSAVVGVVLKALESNEKVGRYVSAILGTAWTAMTYFVVPTLVVDRSGPIDAIKKSLRTLKSTWGEALIGNFSMGFLSFLVMLPILLLGGLLIFFAVGTGSDVALAAAIAITVVVAGFAIAANAAADVIFQTILFHHATGRTLPDRVDPLELEQAFRAR